MPVLSSYKSLRPGDCVSWMLKGWFKWSDCLEGWPRWWHGRTLNLTASQEHIWETNESQLNSFCTTNEGGRGRQRPHREGWGTENSLELRELCRNSIVYVSQPMDSRWEIHPGSLTNLQGHCSTSPATLPRARSSRNRRAPKHAYKGPLHPEIDSAGMTVCC